MSERDFLLHSRWQDQQSSVENLKKEFFDSSDSSQGRFPVFSIDLDGGADPTTKTDYITGTYAITLPGGRVPHSGGIRLRGRGNSTWGAAKKPWRVNFDIATAPLGMSAVQRNWALLANHFDSSKLNNAFALQLGARMSGLAWTPQEVTVELVLNGTYRGLYQFADLVRMEAGRVPGPEPSEEGDGSDGAWLLEISNKERPSGDGEWAEVARNLHHDPGAHSGWEHWWGIYGSGNSGSDATVDVEWSSSGKALQMAWASVTAPGVGYMSAIYGKSLIAAGVTPGTVVTAVIRTVVNRAGITLNTPFVTTGTEVARSRDSLYSPTPGEVVTDWVTFEVPESLAAGHQLAVTIFDKQPGDVVQVSMADLYEGAYQPAREWFYGATPDTDTERFSFVGTPHLSPSVKETRGVSGGEPGFASPVYDQWILWDTPEAPTPEQEAHITGVIGAFETALQAGAWATTAALADYTSFADWWLINELVKNGDSGFWSSCKLHVTAGGVITMGPLWDQDLSLGVTIDSLLPATGWWTRGAAWLTRLWDDPAFQALAATRWTALLTELDAMGGMDWFDRENARLTRAIRDDNTRWAQTTYTALEVDRRKRWLGERIAWITAQLEA